MHMNTFQEVIHDQCCLETQNSSQPVHKEMTKGHQNVVVPFKKPYKKIK